MSATHGTFVWYELMSNDPAASRAFYSQVFGWRYEPMPGSDYMLIHSGAQPLGGILPLTPAMRAGGARPGWLGYVEVDDLEQAVQRVQSLAGTVHLGSTRAGEAGQFALVADPQGALFYLFRSTRTPVPDFSMAPGRVAWRELQGSDWERCFGFYQVLCGWERAELMDGPGGKYQVFKTAGTPAGGMTNVPGQQRGHWRYYLAAENIDAAAARVVAAGGHVSSGPHAITGGMWILEAGDPQGATFAILGPR
jgi:predicted enzyme related to lactoylglutathione lyase